MAFSSTPQSAQYDIIFAGGGPCACIAASRLLESNPDLKILIIEYGSHVKNEARHIQPGQYMRMQADQEVLHFHVGKSSVSLAGRSPIVPTGKAVGGASVVNFMMYTRPPASDYDDWETVYGNRGWGSDSLIPLAKKAETYQEQDPNGTHGLAGPIKVSFAPDLTQIGDAFLQAAQQYDKGRSMTGDINGFYECNKYGKWARYIDKYTGKRSDVPHHYIYDRPENPNLTILTQRIVDSVIIENGRAVGVKYQSIPHPQLGENEARATKFVVLAAGTFGSASILERSGIGSDKVMNKLNIKQVVDLPGVGENYMDHMIVFTPYRGAKGIETMNEIFYGTEKQLEDHVQLWSQSGQGLMAHNGIDAGIKIRPNSQDLEELSPEMQMRWRDFYANSPDRPLLLMGPMAAFIGGPPPSFEDNFFSLGWFQGYLASTGYSHISSRDPRATTDFHPGFLDHPDDLSVMRWGYKKTRELARRMKCYRGELPSGHPAFDTKSNAAVILDDLPHSAGEPDIIYSDEDNQRIEEFIRARVATSLHPCGTCAMKPRAQGGVVDERLNVYGVEGLKVADCSIFPGNVSANLYNTAIVIGEKAAIIISEDLKQCL
ncbi:GMC oxidoreductase-domain-containing protein [Panaeolus papilionaceus]|nr:GMC oxidoreductase-domain-containing protein [Panaeolus papilionaceus]